MPAQKTPASTVIVSNLHSDSIDFATVYNTEDGKQSNDAEAFTLQLGSADDDTDEGRKSGARQPNQSVPDWAIPLLRKSTYFQHLESVRHITVSRAA